MSTTPTKRRRSTTTPPKRNKKKPSRDEIREERNVRFVLDNFGSSKGGGGGLASLFGGDDNDDEKEESILQQRVKLRKDLRDKKKKKKEQELRQQLDEEGEEEGETSTTTSVADSSRVTNNKKKHNKRKTSIPRKRKPYTEYAVSIGRMGKGEMVDTMVEEFFPPPPDKAAKHNSSAEEEEEDSKKEPIQKKKQRGQGLRTMTIQIQLVNEEGNAVEAHQLGACPDSLLEEVAREFVMELDDDDYNDTRGDELDLYLNEKLLDPKEEVRNLGLHTGSVVVAKKKKQGKVPMSPAKQRQAKANPFEESSDEDD